MKVSGFFLSNRSSSPYDFTVQARRDVSGRERMGLSFLCECSSFIWLFWLHRKRDEGWLFHRQVVSLQVRVSHMYVHVRAHARVWPSCHSYIDLLLWGVWMAQRMLSSLELSLSAVRIKNNPNLSVCPVETTKKNLLEGFLFMQSFPHRRKSIAQWGNKYLNFQPEFA